MENYRIYLDETNTDGTRTRYTRQLSSLSLKDCVSNENLQHAESSASVTIPYDAELFSLLARSKELDAQIVGSDDAPLFTGTVTVDISWTDNGRNDEIDKFSLTVKDYSSKFSRKTESEILLENTNLAAVAAHFAEVCGVTIAQTLPETPIQVICIEKGKQILAALEAILYQYGFSFYFSPEGIMQFFDWRDVPENPPELPPEKIRTGFSGSKTTKNYTGVSVSFNTLTTKRNELVYFQGNGYDSNDDPAPFYVQPGVYFPYESSPVLEETDGIVHQSFAQSYAEAKKKYNGEYDYQRNKTATLLYSKNHYVEREWDGTITIDRTDFESKQAAVRLRNTGTADAKVYKLGIRADAVYRDAASTVTAGDQGGNVFTTDFEFVYEMATAESIAKALLAYFAKGNLSFRFQSEEKIEPGSFRRIDTGATGLSCTVFIRSRTLEGKDGQYSYEAQSVSDFVIQTEKSSVNYSQTGAAAIAAVANLKKSLNEGNGNYVPDKITGVKAVAERDGIIITCSKPPKGLKNTITKYIVEISRDEGSSYSSFTALAMPFEYAFIRARTAANAAFDGYPESSDLLKYRIRIKAENVYGNQSEDWSEPVIPDTAEYGTWLLSAPVISPSVSHRSVLLRFSQPVLSSGKERYGTIRHRVEIRQIDLDAAGDFFKPNETDDPNEAETNYKAKATGAENSFVRGYIEVAGDYSQTLPLKGQNEKPPAPTFTTYQYRITALNEKGTSESVTVNVVARPTSVVDVVRGWEYNEQGEKVKVPGALGAENIYAESLSAISVNLGKIKAGTLQSDITLGEEKPNVLLDLDNQEFRVGNEPSLEASNDPDAEYLHWIKGKGLFLKMKNFVLDSLGSLVKGAMTVMSTVDELRRTIISNLGMQIQFFKEGVWKTVAEVIVDAGGNMVITNAPEGVKPLLTIMPESTDPEKPNGVYHLDGTKTDNKGGNFAELDITGSFDSVNPAIDNTLYLNGKIIKDYFKSKASSLPVLVQSPTEEYYALPNKYWASLFFQQPGEIESVEVVYTVPPNSARTKFLIYVLRGVDNDTRRWVRIYNTETKTGDFSYQIPASCNKGFTYTSTLTTDSTRLTITACSSDGVTAAQYVYWYDTVNKRVWQDSEGVWNPAEYPTSGRVITKEAFYAEQANCKLTDNTDFNLEYNYEGITGGVKGVSKVYNKANELLYTEETVMNLKETNEIPMLYKQGYANGAVHAISFKDSVYIKTLKQETKEIRNDVLDFSGFTRYMGWLKGTASVLGIPLLETPHVPEGEDLFHFVVLAINFELKRVEYAVYDLHGNLKAQDTLELDLESAQGTTLEFEGSMQELYVDYDNQLNDSFIQKLISDKHKAGLAEEGYDDSKQWFILNAKDPSAADSNAFYCKKDPAVPIGFVYVQFPGEKSPQELFGCGTWQNVTAQFAGAFFRAEGGNASAFGAGLQDMMIQSHNHGNVITGFASAIGFSWSSSNSQGPTVGAPNSGGIETRPINYTIRIWKRTA